MVDLRLEFLQLKHTANGADIKTEEHTEAAKLVILVHCDGSINEMNPVTHVPAKTG